MEDNKIKELEEKIKFLEEKNKEIEKDKITSIDLIGHEMKKPLVEIQTYINLLSITDCEEERKEILGSIYSKINGALEFQEQILNVAKENFKSCNEKASVKNAIYKIIGDKYILEGSKKKGIGITAPINSLSEKELYVFIGQDLLETVIRNLINNAIKFSKRDGKISINIEEMENEIKFFISDNGIGIKYPEDIFSKIASEEGTEGEKGSGLGLFLCKQILERRGGKIWAENNEDGLGATFFFVLKKIQNGNSKQ